MPRSPRRSIPTVTSPSRTPARRWRLRAGSPAGRSSCDRRRAGGGPVGAAGAADGHCQAGIPYRHLIPAPDDPVFAADQCMVGDCDRTAVSIRRGLCNAHAIRFRKRGRPPMEDFLGAPGPPVRGRRSLAPCTVDGCRYGRGARNGLCSKHRDRWNRAGKPDLATWDAPDLAPGSTMTAECRLPFCSLWVANPAKIFCTGHDDRWHRHGLPDPGRSPSPTANSSAPPASIFRTSPRS